MEGLPHIAPYVVNARARQDSFYAQDQWTMVQSYMNPRVARLNVEFAF